MFKSQQFLAKNLPSQSSSFQNVFQHGSKTHISAKQQHYV